MKMIKLDKNWRMLIVFAMFGLVIGVVIGYIGMKEYITTFTEDCVDSQNHCVEMYNRLARDYRQCKGYDDTPGIQPLVGFNYSLQNET